MKSPHESRKETHAMRNSLEKNIWLHSFYSFHYPPFTRTHSASSPTLWTPLSIHLFQISTSTSVARLNPVGIHTFYHNSIANWCYGKGSWRLGENDFTTGSPSGIRHPVVVLTFSLVQFNSKNHFYRPPYRMSITGGLATILCSFKKSGGICFFE